MISIGKVACYKMRGEGLGQAGSTRAFDNIQRNE